MRGGIRRRVKASVRRRVSGRGRGTRKDKRQRGTRTDKPHDRREGSQRA